MVAENTDAGAIGVVEQKPDKEQGQEVAIRPARVNIVAGRSVRPIVPSDFAETARMAVTIFDSGLAPFGFKKPEAVAVAIMYGAELGLPPMQAIQTIAVINGRPSIYGDGGIALVRASGLLEKWEEYFTGEPYNDDYTAHCIVKRVGEPEVHQEYSVADAKVAKLWNKKGKDGGDTPWVTNPKRMMKWRARGFAFHDTFADVFRGLQFKEVVADYIPPTVDEEPRQSVAARLPGPAEEGVTNGAAIDREVNGNAQAPAAAAVPEPSAEEQEHTALSRSYSEAGIPEADHPMLEEIYLATEQAVTKEEVRAAFGEFEGAVEAASDAAQAMAKTILDARLAEFPVVDVQRKKAATLL